MLPMVSVCVQLDSLVPSVVSDAPLVFMVRTANTTAIVIITMAIVIMYLASVSVYQDLQERPVNSVSAFMGQFIPLYIPSPQFLTVTG